MKCDHCGKEKMICYYCGKEILPRKVTNVTDTIVPGGMTIYIENGENGGEYLHACHECIMKFKVPWEVEKEADEKNDND